MLALLITLVTQFNGLRLPIAQVEVPQAEIEAVYLPAGYEGPIVAAPLDEAVF